MTPRARDNHAEGMVQKKRFLVDKTLCSPLNLIQLRTSDCQNFNLAPSSGQKIWSKNCGQKRFFWFLVVHWAPNWSKLAAKWSKMTLTYHNYWFCENWEKFFKKISDFGGDDRPSNRFFEFCSTLRNFLWLDSDRTSQGL